MDESMRHLIQVTRLTTEATEASKVKHIEEMEKIRARQEEYQRKIERIQNVFQGNLLEDKTGSSKGVLTEEKNYCS